MRAIMPAQPGSVRRRRVTYSGVSSTLTPRRSSVLSTTSSALAPRTRCSPKSRRAASIQRIGSTLPSATRLRTQP
jgi:hypothetical protein